MSKSSCSALICHLTDKDGKILNPYQPNAIEYTELTSPQNRSAQQGKNAAGKPCERNLAAVSVCGYVAVSTDKKTMSAPIPFRIISYISLYAPENTLLNFRVKHFACRAFPIYKPGTAEIDRVDITVHIDTTVRSEANISLFLPEVDHCLFITGKVCVYARRIFDCACFSNETRVHYKKALIKAEVYQYNALSDGEKKFYTNADEITEYGSRGILAPEQVSYYHLFVNGVLQSKTAYAVSKGHLNLFSAEPPAKGESVILTFVTLLDDKNQLLQGTTYQYTAYSDGVKKAYTNQDEVKDYGDKGIPGPDEVSCFSLYVNGVLQPKTNFFVTKGWLQLTTEDVPLKGSFVTLVSLVIKDSEKQLVKAETYQYNARSTGGKVFTNEDELLKYGHDGIRSPEKSSYQNLFVNGMLQPAANYAVQEGSLILKTSDAPPEGTPISLQSVSAFLQQT